MQEFGTAVVVSTIAFAVVLFVLLDRVLGTTFEQDGHVSLKLSTLNIFNSVVICSGRQYYRFSVSTDMFKALPLGRLVGYVCTRGRFTGHIYSVRIEPYSKVEAK